MTHNDLRHKPDKLNPSKRILTRDGEVSLTPKATEILLVLVKRVAPSATAQH